MSGDGTVNDAGNAPVYDYAEEKRKFEEAMNQLTVNKEVLRYICLTQPTGGVVRESELNPETLLENGDITQKFYSELVQFMTPERVEKALELNEEWGYIQRAVGYDATRLLDLRHKGGRIYVSREAARDPIPVCYIPEDKREYVQFTVLGGLGSL